MMEFKDKINLKHKIQSKKEKIFINNVKISYNNSFQSQKSCINIINKKIKINLTQLLLLIYLINL